MDPKQKRRRTMMRVKSLCVGLMILCVGLVHSTVQMAQLRQEKARQHAQNTEKLEELDRQIQVLESEKKKSDDATYIEEVARRDLGMVKPREIVFIDKNKETKMKSSSSEE